MVRCGLLRAWLVVCVPLLPQLTCAASAAGIAPVVHALEPPLPDSDSASATTLWADAADQDVQVWSDACGQCGGAGCDTCQGAITVYGAGLRLFGGVEYLQARPTSSEPLAFVHKFGPLNPGPTASVRAWIRTSTLTMTGRTQCGP